jgi:hypothetical protein
MANKNSYTLIIFAILNWGGGYDETIPEFELAQ